MKKSIFQTIFKGLCFVLFIMITTNGMAQYDHLSKEQKEQKSIELINEAEYLIEGKVIGAESFYGPDGKTLYTDVSIEVIHWYKGKGKKNIHMIQKGGRIKTKDGLTDDQYPAHYHGPFMMRDTPYFMVLKRRSNIREGYEFVDQYNASSYGRYSSGSINDDFYIRAFYSLEFDSMDDFETFISKLEDIKLPRKKKM